MKKIIHLSDLHIGYEDDGEKFRDIVRNLVQKMKPSGDYVVVITGDIVDNATHEGQRFEALDAINRLKKSGYTVLVIPGNHDYGNGAWAHPRYVDIFKEAFYDSAKVKYPKVDVVKGIVFIGLDSTADELHWYDRMLSQGEIGKKQLARLKTILARKKYIKMKKVIYLHHHPFDYEFGNQLKDKEDLKKVIENKADVLLFGHYHGDANSAGKIYSGNWGIKRAYNAGSSTHKNGDTGYHRVIDLSKGPETDYDGRFI